MPVENPRLGGTLGARRESAGIESSSWLEAGGDHQLLPFAAVRAGGVAVEQVDGEVCCFVADDFAEEFFGFIEEG